MKNRCELCGKFRPWDALVFGWSIRQTSVYGDFDEVEWFECAPGVGCRA